MDNKAKIAILVVVIIVALAVLLMSVKKAVGPRKVSMEEQRQKMMEMMGRQGGRPGTSGAGAPVGAAPAGERAGGGQ